VHARIGYGYLVRAKDMDWNPLRERKPLCKQASPLTRGDLIQKSIDQLGTAVKLATSQCRLCLWHWYKPNTAVRRLGFTREKETLAWAQSNLAYALTLRRNQGDLEKAKDSADEAVRELNQLGPDHLQDPRPLIIKDYIVALQTWPKTNGNDKQSDKGKQCASEILSDLHTIDPTTERDKALLAKYPRAATTLHNRLLMEDQLQKIYEMLNTNCEEASQQDTSKASDHQLLFSSLLTLNYIELWDLDAANAKFAELQGIANERKMAKVSANVSLQELYLAYLTGEKKKIDEVVGRLCDVPLTRDSARTYSLCARLQFSRLCSQQQEQLEKTAGAAKRQELLQKAILAAKGKEFLEKAVRAANALPDDSFLRANVAIIQLKLAKFDEAVTTLRRAVQLNPVEPRLRYLLKIALNGNDRFQEARDQAEYGYLLDPEVWLSGEYFKSIDASICPEAKTFVAPPIEGEQSNPIVHKHSGPEPQGHKHPGAK
jgi:tetratricopeptide (TPR) repeat protein